MPVKKCIRSNNVYAQRVGYEDLNTTRPFSNRSPFIKDIRFAHQKEYRFLIQPFDLKYNAEPYRLNIGSISDIVDMGQIYLSHVVTM